MMTPIRKAAVVGAGTMGSGIAVQFANAGVPVVLLDRAPEGAADRRILARQAIERQVAQGGFMHPSAAVLVTPGNIEDDLGLIADADWIIEAIVEDLAVKQALFASIETARKPGSIVSSNTSTLSRERLCQGMPDTFARDFAISHFFNPPRHMRLLEIVGAGADSAVVAAGEAVLGKTAILCRDTPGFIANRLGCYWMAMATLEAMAQGLSVEEADAVVGAPFGVPRTGVFGLFDLVGIDLVPLVWGSLIAALPAADGLHRYDITADARFRAMIADGRFGKKTKAGFYRQGADRKTREVVDLATLAYRPERPVSLGEAGNDLRRLTGRDDACGRYAWTVLKRVVGYASTVAPDIADDVAAIDTALELGYGWRHGPFALADSLGTPWIVERMQADGEAVPPLLDAAAAAGGFYADGGRTVTRGDGSRAPRSRRAGALSLTDVKEQGAPVLRNGSATLWDIGEGVACLELTTKMNIFDDGVFDLIGKAVEAVSAGFRGMVIGNDDPRVFSAGASLSVLLDRIEQGDFAGLRSFVARGQQSFRALRHAPFPVVGAGFGLALGGGCEVLLHCDAIVAHAELNAGLPEVNVGLIPAWGGCTQMLLRAAASGTGAKGPVAVPTRVFEVVAAAKPSSSAADARANGILRDTDTIVMNRDHLLHRARAEVVRMAVGYRAPVVAELMLAGPTGFASLSNAIHGERQAGRISAADAAVRMALAGVLTGGGDMLRPVPEDAVYALEIDALIEMARTPATQERIRHMLTTGKPLRN